MVIISLAQHELELDGHKVWIIVVTVFNYASGEGVAIPFAFDTPQDAEDSFEMFCKIGKLQGGEEISPNPFSDN